MRRLLIIHRLLLVFPFDRNDKELILTIKMALSHAVIVISGECTDGQFSYRFGSEIRLGRQRSDKTSRPESLVAAAAVYVVIHDDYNHPLFI